MMCACGPLNSGGSATIINIIEKIFESNFLRKLFKDTNVICILYKSSQICGTYTNNNTYLGTEGATTKTR
jgi:hypothetical protein